jgi:hypothetical protein
LILLLFGSAIRGLEIPVLVMYFIIQIVRNRVFKITYLELFLIFWSFLGWISNGFILQSLLGTIAFILFIFSCFSFDYKITNFELKILDLGFYFLCLDVLIQMSTGVDLFGRSLMNGYKITGFFPNTYTDSFGLIYFFLYLYRSVGAKKIKKVFFVFSAILAFIVVLLSGSRSIVLVLLSTYLFVAFTTNFKNLVKRLAIYSLVSVSLFSISFSYLYTIPQFERVYNKFGALFILVTEGKVEGSAGERLKVWADFFEIFLEYPYFFIAGLGFESLIPLNVEFFHKRNLIYDDLQAVHLDLIWSLGVVGLILVILIVRNKYVHCRKILLHNKGAIVVLCLLVWWLNPLSVQHKLMSTWYLNQILASIIISQTIMKNEILFNKRLLQG